MTHDESVESWFNDVRASSKKRVDSSTVRVSGWHCWLGRVPKGIEIIWEPSGRHSPTLQAEFVHSAQVQAKVRDPTVKSLKLRSGGSYELGLVTTDSGTDFFVEVDEGTAPERLRITGPKEVRPAFAAPITHMHDGSVSGQAVPRDVEHVIRLSGECRFRAYGNPSRLELELAEDCDLSIDGSLSVGGVTGDHKLSIRKGSLHVKEHSADSKVRYGLVEGTNLTFVRGTSVTVLGTGAISVTELVIGLDAETATIHVTENAQLIEYSGSPSAVDAKPGSLIAGSRGGGFRPTSITTAEKADLTALNPYGLAIGDLHTLEKAEKITFELPRRSNSRRKSEFMVNAGGVDESSNDVRHVANAHFWSGLARIAASSGSSGNVQSQVREAAARSRLRAIRSHNREWWLLTIYKKVRFSESIGIPLLWLVGLAVALTVALAWGWREALVPIPQVIDFSSPRFGIDWRAGSRLLLQVLAWPLAIFRIEPGLELADDAQSIPLAVTLVYRAVAIGLLFFSLAAVRRVTRAE